MNRFLPAEQYFRIPELIAPLPGAFQALAHVFVSRAPGDDLVPDGLWQPAAMLARLPDERHFRFGEFSAVDCDVDIECREISVSDSTELFVIWLEYWNWRANGIPQHEIKDIESILGRADQIGADCRALIPRLAKDGGSAERIRQLSSLYPELKTITDSYRLPWKHAFQFADLPQQLFSDLLIYSEKARHTGTRRFSSAELRLHLQFLRDLYVRYQLTADELIHIQQQEFELPGSLYQRRFPELQRRTEKLHEFQKKILSDSGISMEFPKNLEGDRISINFSVRNEAELDKKIQRLQQLSGEFDYIERVLFEDD